MHYFQFNIGDYASHTSRLTPLEDLAYRRMLDLYYLNEQPLNGCVTDVARELGLSEHVNEVEYILSKFFTKTEKGFSQKRIDLEIKKYKSNSRNKSKAGKASAKARAAKASGKATGVEQALNTEVTNEQLNINHKPITNNHKPITSLINKDKEPKAPKFDFKNELLLLGVDKQVLEDWLTVRKKKKASNTKTAFNGLINEITKSGLIVSDAIEYAASKSWSGFKAQWYLNENPLNQAKQYSDVTAQNIKNLEGGW
tara:strand:+ start:343 stop:1107 length:765 start_codon:yes stop_codon:yes gene_type:complete